MIYVELTTGSTTTLPETQLFDQLIEFVEKRMRMSHIYQPVMLMELLLNGGECSTEQIARAILQHDQSQVEYYEKITRDMVGRVLRNHGIVTKQGQSYSLNGFSQLSETEIESLIATCQAKLDDYLAHRGTKIWQHRKMWGFGFSGGQQG